MKKHIFSLFMGYILLLHPLIGLACASDSYEAALDSLFSATNRAAEPTFNDEFIFNPNPFSYDLSAINLDPWQTEIPLPEAFATFDATDNIPILELDFSHEATTAAAQTPLAPTKTPATKHACTAALDCIYTTTVKSNLTRHMRYHHNGEKPYKCPVTDCTYRTAYQYHLPGHIQHKHTDKKSFACVDCDYTTTQPDYVTRHMRNKHNKERSAKRQR